MAATMIRLHIKHFLQSFTKQYFLISSSSSSPATPPPPPTNAVFISCLTNAGQQKQTIFKNRWVKDLRSTTVSVIAFRSHILKHDGVIPDYVSNIPVTTTFSIQFTCHLPGHVYFINAVFFFLIRCSHFFCHC